MKRIMLLTALLLIFFKISYSQNEGVTSKPIVEIFTDLHVNLAKSQSSTSGFSLNRAFFGYSYAIDKNFSAVIILNIASPDEMPNGSKPRRYAFFREASMNYSNQKLNVTMGMVKTKLFMFQQGWWGMRYIAKPFQDLNCYGTDADLGLAVSYKFSDLIEADISLLNGEGGGNLQLDNRLKATGGLTITPSKNFTLRLYDDIMKNTDVWQNTSLLFAGYKTEKFFLGAELNYKTNLDTISGHNAWGLSTTGGVHFSDKMMFFTRYDIASSVIPQGEVDSWNYTKDSNLLIIGLQYSISKAVRIAVDYQGKFPSDKSKSNSNMIYLNLVMKI